jgi:Na+-driven multidrug efflux pump
MRAALRDAALVTGLYVAVVWLALFLGRGPLTALFGLEGAGADLLGFFCLAGGAIWFFNGLLFLGNASFNNLGFPLAASALNWGRATLGTMPPALLGAHLAGPEGAMAGMGIGSALFGVMGLALAFRVVGVLERREAVAGLEADGRQTVERPVS